MTKAQRLQQGRNHLSMIIDGHGCVVIHRVEHGAESRWEIGRSTLAHVCEGTRVDIYLERCPRVTGSRRWLRG